MSAAIERAFCCIGFQSVTAVRTSSSTCAMSAARRSSASVSTVRSTSMWMNDSSAGAVPSSGASDISVPSAARTTPTIGWMIRCSVRPCRLTSIATESTRNGMSSLTISTTVCRDCQPCSSSVGLKARTRARPGSRLRAKFQCDSAAP